MPRGRCSAGGGALLLLAMTTAVVMMTHAHSQETHELLEEDATSTEELTTPDLSRVSPLSSWLIFRRNSNKGDNRRSKTSRSRSSKHGLPGPPGPPGPQGPPGPPGPPLATQQELIQELRELAAAEGACLLCGPPPPSPPLRVATSFLGRLAKPLAVPRRSLLELLPFSKPSASERSLQRGQSFNSSSGRYTAPLDGFYQLTASLLMESGDRAQVRLRDSVRAAICIESLCQSNLSVESVMGMAAAGGTFSILLTGTLYLQAGAYVSIFVDNGSGSAVTVLQDSLFSGILLGV